MVKIIEKGFGYLCFIVKKSHVFFFCGTNPGFFISFSLFKFIKNQNCQKGVCPTLKGCFSLRGFISLIHKMGSKKYGEKKKENGL